MNPLQLLGLFAACFAFGTAYAGNYGSETVVTLEGSIRSTEPDAVKNLKSGDVRVTRSYQEKTINNATVLRALVKRDLIPTVSGHSIVLVAQGMMKEGIGFFAICEGRAPVRIPSDILALSVADGPGDGVLVEGSGLVKSLDMETFNLASLKVNGFEGTGVLDQDWSAGTVTKNGVSESVQLVKSSGVFSGMVNGSTDAVGVVGLRLSNAKTTHLKRYGMVTSGSGTATSGSVSVSNSSFDYNFLGGTLDISITPIDVITGGTSLVLNGSNTYTGGALTLYSTAVTPGVTFAFDGVEMPISTFGINPANELTLNTAEGPVVYTREGTDVWSLVVPQTETDTEEPAP